MSCLTAPENTSSRSVSRNRAWIFHLSNLIVNNYSENLYSVFRMQQSELGVLKESVMEHFYKGALVTDVCIFWSDCIRVEQFLHLIVFAAGLPSRHYFIFYYTVWLFPHHCRLTTEKKNKKSTRGWHIRGRLWPELKSNLCSAILPASCPHSYGRIQILLVVIYRCRNPYVFVDDCLLFTHCVCYILFSVPSPEFPLIFPSYV